MYSCLYQEIGTTSKQEKKSLNVKEMEYKHS